MNNWASQSVENLSDSKHTELNLAEKKEEVEWMKTISE